MSDATEVKEQVGPQPVTTERHLLKTIRTGPFRIFFTNINKEMALGGHSHYAEVSLTWRTMDTRGFPAFAETYVVLQDRLKALTDKPFRGFTNENVADYLYAGFRDMGPHSDPILEKWGGSWELVKLELAVMGVPDKIGHADGLTIYTVERPAGWTYELP